MATLGETAASVVSNDSGNGTGILVVYSAFSQYVFTASSNVSKMTASVNVTSGTQLARLVMFADVAGVPATTALLTSDEVSVSNTAQAFTDFTITGQPISVPAQTVWLGIWYGTNTGGGVQLWDASAGTTTSNARYNIAVTYASTGAVPTVGGWTTGGGRGAIYATYSLGSVTNNKSISASVAAKAPRS